MSHRTVVVFAVVALITACGSEEESEEPTADVPGFLQLHEEVFEPGCTASACHAGDTGIAGLSFDDPQTAYDQLVDVPPSNSSAQNDGLLRVDPGDPDNSFLWWKLTAAPGELADEGYGEFMPIGTSTVPDEDSLSAIEEWIEGGAPYDGLEFEGDFEEASFDNYVDCDADDEQGLRECHQPEPDPDEFLRLYSPKLQIPANSDTTLCSYLDFHADEDITLTATRGQQMNGGHHIAVFLANSPSDDFEPGECSDEEMMNFRYVAGAGGGGGLDTEMPDGVGLRIQEGQQVVIQSHYINTTDEPVYVMDAVDLEYADDDAIALADPFAMIDSGFEVPADSDDYVRTSECTADDDMEIYMLLGHTHEYGSLFEFEYLPGGEEDQAEQWYFATDGRLLRNTPQIKMYDPPLQIDEGDTFRMSCGWDNPYDRTLTWPEEMCVGLMYYGPSRGWMTCGENDPYPTILGGDAEGCAVPGDMGNELGVGRYCTQTECQGQEADFCLAGIDSASNFCSILNCDEDDECGDDAVCHHDDLGSACVPDECLEE